MTLDAGEREPGWIGTTVGSIRIDSRLGAGGMGEVYLGFDQKLERRVAVKTLQADQRLSGRQRERFLREARLLSRIGHPGICQVYDLVASGGADFLILEFVPGRTLRRFIEEAPSLERRLALAIEIATALAAAHRERVVHRDLKAENIMVTPEERIKILDFGIARSLADEEPEPPEEPLECSPAAYREGPATERVGVALGLRPAGPASMPTSRLAPARDAALTLRGHVMGTITAMSPEQATGGTVDEASDLYSLGVLLQELLTGEPAYAPAEDEELMWRVARAETRPIIGLDADLALLLRDLESLDPRRRPPADAVVERLRWIGEKPQRERRRRLRALATGSAFVVLLAMLAIVGRLAYVSSRARLDAETRRQQAEGLIDFMLNDLREKLTAVGRLDLLEGVDDRALAYFDSVPESSLSTADLARRVQTILQVGEVRRLQGNNGAALTAFRRGTELAEQALREHPGDDGLMEQLANGYEEVGQVHYDQTETAAADVQWSRFLQIAEQMTARAPANWRALGLRANAEHDLGTVREQAGDLAGALALYERSIADQQRLVAARPEQRWPKEALANTHAFVAVALERQGDLEASRRHRREHLEIFERLSAAEPADSELRQDVAVAQGLLANVLGHFGSAAEAARLYASGGATMDELSAKDPQNAELRRWRAVFRLAIHDLDVAGGRAAEASRALREACEIVEALSASDPASADWRLQLAVCRMRTAVARATAGSADARGALERAVTVVEPLAAETTGELALAQLMAAEVLHGRAAAALGIADEARRAREHVIALGGRGRQPVRYWRLLVPWSEALMELERTAEAAPLVAQLRGLHFDRPDWTALCRKHGL